MNFWLWALYKNLSTNQRYVLRKKYLSIVLQTLLRVIKTNGFNGVKTSKKKRSIDQKQNMVYFSRKKKKWKEKKPTQI